jgi:hypothetical protein
MAASDALYVLRCSPAYHLLRWHRMGVRGEPVSTPPRQTSSADTAEWVSHPPGAPLCPPRRANRTGDEAAEPLFPTRGSFEGQQAAGCAPARCEQERARRRPVRVVPCSGTRVKASSWLWPAPVRLQAPHGPPRWSSGWSVGRSSPEPPPGDHPAARSFPEFGSLQPGRRKSAPQRHRGGPPVASPDHRGLGSVAAPPVSVPRGHLRSMLRPRGDRDSAPAISCRRARFTNRAHGWVQSDGCAAGRSSCRRGCGVAARHRRR